MKNLGLMQGRLSKSIDGQIQFFPWESWKDEFRLLELLEISILEWTLDHNRLFENPLLTADGLITIDSLKKRYGVRINSVTCDNLMQAPVFHTDDLPRTTQEELIELFWLGSKTNIRYWIWPLVDQGAPKNEQHWNVLFSSLEEIKVKFRNHNIEILFETELSPQKNHEFISTLSHPMFGLNLDIGNSVAYGFDPREEFEINSNFIRNIHIKDRFRNGPSVPLGEGDVNWITLRNFLGSFNGSLILQCARTQSPEFSQIQRYQQFMVRLLEEGRR